MDDNTPRKHQSGFVNIIGHPNVGKSTLMNALVGENMSIVTSKPQTTRHRIFGILSSSDFQIVFSDTPGIIIDPRYKMQEHMNKFVEGSFEDADLFLFVVDKYDKYAAEDPIFDKFRKAKIPVILIINKSDLIPVNDELDKLSNEWKEKYPFDFVHPVSALYKLGTQDLLKRILEHLPESPAYFDKDHMSDRSERFFASEIIREKIFLHYKEEIPYSSEVAIDTFKEDETKDPMLIRIHATIYVERKTQKSIIIGKGGEKIKQLGIDARKDLEKFFEAHVYLELFVKVKENWRDDDQSLRHFGYTH